MKSISGTKSLTVLKKLLEKGELETRESQMGRCGKYTEKREG